MQIGHKQHIGYKVSVIAGLCTTLWVAPWGAIAQDTDAPSGPQITLDVTQSFESSDNFDLNATNRSGLRGVTNLGFAITSETRSQRLRLGSNVSLRYGSLGANEETLGNPNLALDYVREGANSRFTTRLNYSQSDTNTSFTQRVGPFEFLFTDEGLRQNINGVVGLELGLEGPLGASFELSHNSINYTNTRDPDLFDADTTTANAALRFDLNSQLTARLTGSVSTRDTTGNGVDRDSHSLGLGLSYDISPSLRTTAAVNYTSIELLGGAATAPVDRTEEGLGFSVGFEADLPRGGLSASLSSEVGENGTRTSLNTTRVFELPRAEMALSFGLSKTENISGVNPLFGIRYAQEFKRGAMNLSLSQSIGARSDSEEVRATTLSLAYNHELSALARVNTTLSLQDNTILGSTEPDSSRIDLSLAYRHELVREWDLVSTYTHSLSRSDDRADFSSNTISLGVQRSFNWTP